MTSVGPSPCSASRRASSPGSVLYRRSFGATPRPRRRLLRRRLDGLVRRDGSPEAEKLLPVARDVLAAAPPRERRGSRRRSSSTPISRATSSCAPGKRSRYYLDKYRFETRPDLLRPLGERIAAAVREHAPDADAPRRAGARRGRARRCGVARSGLPFLIVRKEAKEYGTANRLEGPYEEGECVCLVEDVVTSGRRAARVDRGAPRGRSRRAHGGLRGRS